MNGVQLTYSDGSPKVPYEAIPTMTPNLRSRLASLRVHDVYQDVFAGRHNGVDVVNSVRRSCCRTQASRNTTMTKHFYRKYDGTRLPLSSSPPPPTNQKGVSVAVKAGVLKVMQVSTEAGSL